MRKTPNLIASDDDFDRLLFNIMNTKTTNSLKTYKFTIGLLYPGVLGSIIYGLFDHFFKVGAVHNLERYGLILLLIGVFVFDYLYTSTKEVEEQYTKSQGFVDILIVVVLFSSVNIALHSSDENMILIPLILAVGKSFCLVWEILRTDNMFLLPICLYLGFSIYYALVFYSGYLFLVFAGLLVDIFISLNIERLNARSTRS